MSDYWGAHASPSYGGPDDQGAWYNPPTDDGSDTFTDKPTSDGTGGTKIEVIYHQIMNTQPAHVSALADQWLNMWYLLSSIHDQLLTESTDLYEEKWKSGKAREAFMQSGPGQTLAYMDEWMNSAMSNNQALNALAGIMLDYQSQMTTLWNEYVAAAKSANHISAGRDFLDGLETLTPHQWDQKNAAKKLQQVQKVQDQYSQKAQVKAWAMAQEIFQTYSTFDSGHGPLYEPPDVVLDNPMLPHIPLPGGGGPPGAPGMPSAPPAPPPPPAAPNLPPAMTLTPMPTLSTPVPPPPGLPTAPNLPPTAPGLPPGTVPGMPPGMPGLFPGLLPPGIPGGLPDGLPGSVPGSPGTLQNGEPNPFAAPRAPSQSLISRPGSVPNAARAGSPSMPPGMQKGIRNPRRSGTPGEEESGMRGRGRSARGGVEGEEELNSHAMEEESPFGSARMPSAPPVLKNGRRRDGSRRTTPARLDDEISTGLSGRDGSVSPILGRPAAPTGDAPSLPGLGRRGRKQAAGRESVQRPPAVEGADNWLGVGSPSAGLTAPILKAAAPPLTGGAVSNLEEVPPALRGVGRAGTLGGRSTKGGPSELTNRNARRKTTTTAPVDEREQSSVVSDEEAFSVDTPGGGVLAGREEQQITPEQKAQLRAH